VFNNGTEKGFKGSIPAGGQHTPISTEGDKLPTRHDIRSRTGIY